MASVASVASRGGGVVARSGEASGLRRRGGVFGREPASESRAMCCSSGFGDVGVDEGGA